MVNKHIKVLNIQFIGLVTHIGLMALYIKFRVRPLRLAIKHIGLKAVHIRFIIIIT